ncbi:hypothetical protein SAMN05444141_104409 [Pseudovibrio denitrificans]|uniref:Uncharacterized protein n=1 Tax=Pseudovibrio denitrificans TaxID=258256 RepID=A0A1I7BWB9_9HYPH|nr:hypothetical protein SAMN05444141_104409 [Pseudovibrio denitrificans]
MLHIAEVSSVLAQLSSSCNETKHGLISLAAVHQAKDLAKS